ncbi:glycosyltransferase [Kaarinaea lacus]
MTIQGYQEKLDCFVSVVVVVNNDGKMVEAFLREAQRHLATYFTDYEILIIDQCSTDGTLQLIEQLLREVPSVRFIELSAPVYLDIALAAGIENAIGDFVVLMDPKSDPVDCILDIVELCRKNHDIVIGVANQDDSFAYQLVRPVIHMALRAIGYNLPRNATNLRCLSRRAVNSVTQAGRFHQQFFVRISNTGYPTAIYRYVLKPNSGVRRTLVEGVRQAIRMTVFNSTRPLRWMSVLGVVGSVFAFVFASYSIIINLFKNDVVEGWTSMVFFMSFLFAILFAILAFFGEYLGRLLDDRSEHQAYSVADEKTSSVMLLEEHRYNVLNESDQNR